jgi:subfamily B ATP-binding cassette protein MsbA
MNNFFRIFRYIHIPKDKLALYILFTLLGTLFSLLSIGMLGPFMNILFQADTAPVPARGGFVESAKNYVEAMARTDKSKALAWVCVIIAAATLLKNIFLYLSFYISTPVRNNILSGFRTRLYEKILQLPISFYSEQRKGDIMNRMIGDVGEVQGSIVMALEGLIKDPLTIIAFLGYLIYLSPQLSLFLLVLLPVTALIIGRISKRLKKQSGDFSRAAGENLAHVEETLGGIKIIKAFRAESSMMEKFRLGDHKLFDILNRMTLRRDLASPLTEVLGVLVLCFILYVGGRMVFSQENSLNSGDLVSFILCFAMMINPSKNLASTISNIKKGLGAIGRIEEILHAPNGIQEKPNAATLDRFNDAIELRNVSFSYEGKQALKNINLTLRKGKTIALVGASGSGKSTLADLIPRFHDVGEGEVLIDGINIKEYTISSLRKQMGFVTQEPILFNDSIAANIALGEEDAKPEAIAEAARIANAHSFITAKEQGYATNIGDRGNKLSGGERQRLTIARAVLRNPPILILDEATSSLDTESERLVQDAIEKLMKDRTSLIIAHRLSTIRKADEILVLQKGEIIERGTHENLIGKNGFYKKLVDMQELG